MPTNVSQRLLVGSIQQLLTDFFTNVGAITTSLSCCRVSTPHHLRSLTLMVEQQDCVLVILPCSHSSLTTTCNIRSNHYTEGGGSIRVICDQSQSWCTTAMIRLVPVVYNVHKTVKWALLFMEITIFPPQREFLDNFPKSNDKYYSESSSVRQFWRNYSSSSFNQAKMFRLPHWFSYLFLEK